MQDSPNKDKFELNVCVEFSKRGTGYDITIVDNDSTRLYTNIPYDNFFTRIQALVNASLNQLCNNIDFERKKRRTK